MSPAPIFISIPVIISISCTRLMAMVAAGTKGNPRNCRFVLRVTELKNNLAIDDSKFSGPQQPK
jgi:hypothetical protein